MDKILAFSILSSSPADIAGAPVYATTRVISWRTGADTKKQQQQQEQAEEKKRKVQQSAPLPERKREAQARFAPEFDGINCFESIVSF